MPTANEVADYLIFLAAEGEEPDMLSPLRLQKLLYYVQGWSLALRDKEMFPEELEAWVHGPVVPGVYHRFSEFGHASIPREVIDVPELAEDDARFIESVWEAYKAYSATSLKNMTHNEAPWRKARHGYGPADTCNEVIPKDEMKAFFQRTAKQK